MTAKPCKHRCFKAVLSPIQDGTLEQSDNRKGGAAMREKHIEQRLVRALKNAGGLAIKLMSPGFDGMPDRLVLLPGARIAFVEVKALGVKPRPLQLKRHEMLRQMGFKVYVIDDKGQIQPMLSKVMEGGDAR